MWDSRCGVLRTAALQMIYPDMVVSFRFDDYAGVENRSANQTAPTSLVPTVTEMCVVVHCCGRTRESAKYRQ